MAENSHRAPARRPVQRVPAPGARPDHFPGAGRMPGTWISPPAPECWPLGPTYRNFPAPGPIQTFRGPPGRRGLQTASRLRAAGDLADLGAAMGPPGCPSNVRKIMIFYFAIGSVARSAP